MPAAANIFVCHRCPLRPKGTMHGSCVCLVDGREIVHHAEAGACPKGFYPNLPAQRLLRRGFGDVLAAWFARMRITRLVKWCERKTGKPCGCRGRQEGLNKATEQEVVMMGASRR